MSIKRTVLECGAFLLCAVAAVTLPPHVSFADDNKPVCVQEDCFPGAALVGSQKLPLAGATRFRYLFFNVYSIALYAPRGVRTIEGILATDVPKRLVLRYHHRFTREQIIRGGTEMMMKNPAVDFSAIKAAADQMNALYMEAVHKEDEYEISYVPGEGLSLYFNEQLRGTVPGAEFARAYLGIWLSNTPIDEEMRDALLGGQQP